MFKDFMKKYIGDVTMKGKLAEDIRRDSLFPKNDTSISEIWHKVIKDYLIYDNDAAEASSKHLKNVGRNTPERKK